jgi:hypothetical protein
MVGMPLLEIHGEALTVGLDSSWFGATLCKVAKLRDTVVHVRGCFVPILLGKMTAEG